MVKRKPATLRWPAVELVRQFQETAIFRPELPGTAWSGSGLFKKLNRYGPLKPDADPDAFAPAAATPITMAPVATADPSPHAAPSAATMAVIPIVIPMMPITMVNLLQFCFILPVLENGWIRLVELVQDSVAAGNTGNRFAWSGEACKCCSPRNAKHSSQKQPTFHQNLPSC